MVKYECLDSMTTEELKALQDSISEVLEKRLRERKEKKWRAVCEAMADYAGEFGDIYVLTPEGEYNCCRADYSDFGYIQF